MTMQDLIKRAINVGKTSRMIKEGFTDEEIIAKLSEYEREQVKSWIDMCRKAIQLRNEK